MLKRYFFSWKCNVPGTKPSRATLSRGELSWYCRWKGVKQHRPAALNFTHPLCIDQAAGQQSNCLMKISINGPPPIILRFANRSVYPFGFVASKGANCWKSGEERQNWAGRYCDSDTLQCPSVGNKRSSAKEGTERNPGFHHHQKPRWEATLSFYCSSLLRLTSWQHTLIKNESTIFTGVWRSRISEAGRFSTKRYF